MEQFHGCFIGSAQVNTTRGVCGGDVVIRVGKSGSVLGVTFYRKKTHGCFKPPDRVNNPELDFISVRVLGLICLWSTGEIVVGCPS